MKRRLAVVALLFGVAAGGLFAAPQATDSAQGKIKNDSAQKQDLSGEELFEARCGNCHTAPQEVPPKAAATILRHMRVRAMLTAEEEQKLLKFMAP